MQHARVIFLKSFYNIAVPCMHVKLYNLSLIGEFRSGTILLHAEILPRAMCIYSSLICTAVKQFTSLLSIAEAEH